MKKNFIVIIGLIIFTICACTKKFEGEILAQVDKEILTVEDMHNTFTEDVWNKMSFEEKNEIINQWVNLTLLSNLAKHNNYIESNPFLKFNIDNSKKKILSNAFIANEISKIDISEEELYNYYKINQSEFVRPVKEYRIQRIFFHQKSDMDVVKNIIDNQEMSYTAAAQKYSAEAIGRNGGYVSNFITKTGQDSLLWNELNKINKFDVITLAYDNGFMIVRYYDYRESLASMNFYELKDEIRDILQKSKMNEVYNQLIDESKRLNNVIINL